VNASLFICLLEPRFFRSFLLQRLDRLSKDTISADHHRPNGMECVPVSSIDRYYISDIIEPRYYLWCPCLRIPAGTIQISILGLYISLHIVYISPSGPLSIKVDLEKRVSNFVTSPRELTVFPIVKLLKRTIEDERQMNFDALETALAAAMTKLPRRIPVPCLTCKKVFVGIGRGYT
jgi:hypothetical protein